MDDALSNIPFYSAYIQRRAQNEQAGQREDAANLQQATGAMSLLSHLAAQQSDQQLKQHLAESGGDLTKAMQAAILTGNLSGAAKLAPLLKQQQDQKLQESFSSLAGNAGSLTPDQLDQYAMKVAPHSATAAASFTRMADQRRERENRANTLGMMRDVPQGLPAGTVVGNQETVTDIPASDRAAFERVAAADAMGQKATVSPQDAPQVTMGGGALAPLIAHPNSIISGRARFLQQLINNPDFKGNPADLEKQVQNLTNQALVEGRANDKLDNKTPQALFVNVQPDGKGGWVGLNRTTNRMEALPSAEGVTAVPKPLTSIGKINEDLRAGRITQAQYDAHIESSTKASDDVIKAVAEGRMQMPTGFALRSPYWQNVVERVAAIDPNFDAGKYGARAAARRTFASGPEARNVTAINTVIGHLGTLDEAATALNNKDLRAFNSVANRLATELGDPRIQNFDTAKQAVAEETMRVFRQVGASEMEARMWGERITASGSPDQLRGVIGTLGTLLDSRVQAIGQQFERTVNQTGNPASVDPKNRVVLDKLINQGKQPTWDDAKERRYQELLRKRNGPQ
jgi:hypothetical protein